MSIMSGEFGGDRVDRDPIEGRVTPIPAGDFANERDVVDPDQSLSNFYMMPEQRRLQLAQGLGARPLDEVMSSVSRHPSAQPFHPRS